MPGRIDRLPGPVLLLLAATAGVFAAFVALTGGIDTQIGGIPLRSRSWERPAGLAAVLAAVGIYRARRPIVAAVRSLGKWVTTAVPRVVGPLPVVLACGAGALAIAFGTFAAGGADSYGYVSQAELFARGRVTEHVDIRGLNWPEVRYTLAPLGYRVGSAEGTISPSYPPGLPLLMAPLAVVHPRGVFLIVPLCAACAVWLCFLMGRELAGWLAGTLSALLFAVSPTFLFHAVQPMSDVPATTFWLAALLLAKHPAGSRAATAGLVTSLAILIRPNLAPLAVFVITAAAAGSGIVNRRNALVCVGALLPGLLALGLIQQVRYGSPVASGYGDLNLLFRWENIAPNLDRYPRWLTEWHTPLVWLWLLAPAWILHAWRVVRTYAWICYGFSLAVFAVYLPYIYFQPDEWHYTRFLLPALPLVMIFTVCVVLESARRAGPMAFRVAVLLLAGLAIVLAVKSVAAGTFGLHDVEAKYEEVGRLVRDRLPESAFVLALQHSGSIRYYSGRRTLRWDVLDRTSLGQAIASLRSAGYTPYAVLDSGEVEEFRKRFGATAPDVVERMVVVGRVRDTRVYAFP